MRPRVFPAENALFVGRQNLDVLASMRPRVFPAENILYLVGKARHHWASMRPRVFPAENADAMFHALHEAELQ